MDQLSLFGSSVNEIYSQIVKEFGWGIERPELIIKMEKVLDRCLESPQQLDRDHVEKIYEILHWSILEQKSCKIQSMVAKAYKVVSLHFPKGDWKEIVQDEPRIHVADLFSVTQSLLYGDEISIQKLCECIHFGRWDILLLLYYTGAGIDQEIFVKVIKKALAMHYEANKFPDALACLKKIFDFIEFNEVWKDAFSEIIGNIEDQAFERFVGDFPWQKFSYVACSVPSSDRVEKCLEKGIPWGSVLSQKLHWYSRVKIYYFNAKKEIQQPNVIELKDWYRGKRIDCRKMIAHIGHQIGSCRYFLSKDNEHRQEYEWFFTNRHMYKALKKGLLDDLEEDETIEGLTKQFFDNSLETAKVKLFNSIMAGEPCSFETGFAKPEGHSIEVFCFDPYVIICDSSPCGEYALKIFHMNKDKLTLDMLTKLMEKDYRTKEEALQLLQEFIQKLECRPHQLSQNLGKIELLRKKQIVNNCSWMSKELAFFFYLYLLKFKQIASEEEWTKGLDVSEEKQKKLSERTLIEIMPVFYSILSRALLRFIDKEIISIENKEDSLDPDWEFLVKVLLNSVFVRIEEHKPLFDQRLQKILKLMPTKELSIMLSLMPHELIKTKILVLLSLQDLIKLKDMVDNQDIRLLIQMRIIQLL